MKLSNKKLIEFITNEFNKINVKFDVLQNKHKYKEKFYRGYIYINNLNDLTDYQNKYINDNIYPILIENDWENLFMLSNNLTKEEIIKEYFPILEKY